MKHLKVAVCDDEAFALGIVSDLMEKTLKSKDIVPQMECFSHAKELSLRMQQERFDLLLLDIDMPGIDGIQFAHDLRSRNSHADIIFVSSREDRVFDALRVNPVGFIRKSCFLEDVPSVIEIYLKEHVQKRENENPNLVLQTRDGVISIPFDDILYIEGAGKNQLIHVTNRKEAISCRFQLQELEDKLSPSGFLRIHKGFLVNHRFIRRIEDSEILLTNQERIPLSRRKTQEIRDRYLALVKDSSVVF